MAALTVVGPSVVGRFLRGVADHLVEPALADRDEVLAVACSNDPFPAGSPSRPTSPLESVFSVFIRGPLSAAIRLKRKKPFTTLKPLIPNNLLICPCRHHRKM